MGTDIRDLDELFLFAYWIPLDLLLEPLDLKAILELFIYRFGIKLNIDDEENYIISNKLKLVYNTLESFEKEFINFDYKNAARVNYTYLYSSRLTGSINYVHINYLFAINVYKYQFWLFQIKNDVLKVREGWRDWVSNIKDYIRPDGKSKIEILRPEKEIKLEVQENQLKDILIPTNYKNQFARIIDVVNSLSDKEKIGVRISSIKKNCLFCGSDKLSKEHIIPDWVKPYFMSTLSSLYRIDQYPDESLKEALLTKITNKKESLLGYTDNSVCIECNTGWMKKMEDESKSALIKEGKIIENPELISESESIAISRWITKIAILTLNKEMGSETNNYKFILEDLKNKKISPGIYIEVAKTKYYNILSGLIMGQNLSNKEGGDLMSTGDFKRNFFRFSFQFGKILFRLSYLDPEALYVRKTGVLQTKLIYPKNGDIIFVNTENNTLLEGFESESLYFHLFSRGVLIEKIKRS